MEKWRKKLASQSNFGGVICMCGMYKKKIDEIYFLCVSALELNCWNIDF